MPMIQELGSSPSTQHDPEPSAADAAPAPAPEQESISDTAQPPAGRSGGLQPALKPAGQGLVETPCVVCKQQLSRYTCPRCLARYCAKDCYIKHGARCTEAFYREQVVDQLESQPVASEEDRREMLAILKKLHAEEQDELESNEVKEDQEAEVNSEFIGTALEQVNLTEDTEWEDLTPEQQKAFIKAAEDGKLGQIFEPWRPWWISSGPMVEHGGAGGSPSVAPGEDTTEESAESSRNRVPPIPENLQPLHSLSSKPSPLLPFTLIGLLFSYVHCQRRCNGEATDPAMTAEAAETLLQAAGPLLTPPAKGSTPSVPQSVQESFRDCVERVAAVARIPSPLLLEISEDLTTVSSFKIYVMAALSEAHAIIQAAANLDNLKKSMKSKLEKSEKKLWFFLCWANEQTKEVFELLGASVSQIKQEIVEENKNFLSTQPSQFSVKETDK